jgi:hypothetical protein
MVSLPQLQSLPEASNFFEWFDSITKDISSELKNVHLQILVNAILKGHEPLNLEEFTAKSHLKKPKDIIGFRTSAVVPQLPQDFIPSTILRGLTSLNLTNESSI